MLMLLPFPHHLRGGKHGAFFHSGSPESIFHCICRNGEIASIHVPCMVARQILNWSEESFAITNRIECQADLQHYIRCFRKANDTPYKCNSIQWATSDNYFEKFQIHVV